VNSQPSTVNRQHHSGVTGNDIIEVSDSNLKYAQRTKLSLYAEAEIFNYWIFYLVYHQREMHSEPDQKKTR
jgi:hypothetical protein